MAGDVRVVLDHGEIARLAVSEDVRTYLLAASAGPTHTARATAPYATGAGAASIQAESVLDDAQWTVRVGWDRLHYYMRFHETGTRYLPARPFLVPAFN